MIYFLELENKKYYIGYSKKINDRIYQHFHENGLKNINLFYY